MKPVIIGIAGPTASGKSTLSALLVDALPALHITQDSYYRSMPPESDVQSYNFDHPDAFDGQRLAADLDLLRASQPATVPRYDYAVHRRTDDEILVQPQPYVVVEGILVFQDPELRARFDVRVYVDAPADLRLIRRIRRDMETRGRTVAQILGQYERTVRPMHHEFVAPSRTHADLILDGTQPQANLLRSVLSQLGR